MTAAVDMVATAPPRGPSKFDKSAPRWAEIYRHLSAARQRQVEFSARLAGVTVRDYIEGRVAHVRSLLARGVIR